MPANVCNPYFQTSDITFRATGAVTGKTFIRPGVSRTGGPGLSTDGENVYEMQTCGAGLKAFGVAAYDVADNKLGRVIGTPGRIVPVTCGANIAVGVEVESNASGQAITLASGKALGLCVTAATSGGDAEIQLY